MSERSGAMTALVTGGTGGIGRHIAAGLRAAGLDVVITGRDATRGEAVARELGASFVRAEHATVAGNVALAGQLAARTPVIDVLVNNVGGAAHEHRMTADVMAAIPAAMLTATVST